jgi:uncharacterized membrane protein YhaH (DUF805 family)
MHWMLLPLKRYADFRGRSRRKEFWMFVLFQIIVYTVGLMLEGLLGFGTSTSSVTSDGTADFAASYYYNGGPVFWIIWLALLIPGLAVTVRRFHDQDRTGWMVLLGLIPFVGGIILIVFMCLEGTRGSNRYGMDPKGPGDETSDVFS